jgi:hypothetical protein
VAGHLYVSFWHLSIDNLPQGHFEHREISAGDAGAMIRAARADKTLLCVSDDDLLAPYRTTEHRRHEELCALLRARYDCPLRFEDFLTAFDDEEGYSIMPLQVAELQGADRLLVVTCNYEFARTTENKISLEERFALAEDSVEFHLISATGGQSGHGE